MASAEEPQHREGTPINSVASGAMTHYSQHQQPPLLQSGPAQDSAPGSYNQYRYINGLNSPSTASPAVSNPMDARNVLPPPRVGAQGAMQGDDQGFDTTGQHPLPGMKPRVTPTLWEDEGSLCFLVEARGICVARREDNDMINGTKLLNVAGVTRGRRDGILKGEKVRQVVKIGPMHLRGVWIPYDRALDFANKEKITELLYPLFVHDIVALLYDPTNQSRTAQVMAAAERRKQEQNQMQNPAPPGLPSMSHSHPSMALPSPQTSVPSHNTMARPQLDRAHTFPTPPTSGSSIMGSMGTSESFNWQGMSGPQGTNPMAIDTSLNMARSRPTTPATTPPGSSIQMMQSYASGAQDYDNSRSMYSTQASRQDQNVSNSTSSPIDPKGLSNYPNSPTKIHQSPASTLSIKPDTMLRPDELLKEESAEVDTSSLASTSAIPTQPLTETLQKAQGPKPQVKSPALFDNDMNTDADELLEERSSDTEFSSASDYSEGIPCLDEGHPFLRAKSDIVKSVLTTFDTQKLKYIEGLKETVSGNDCASSSHTVGAGSTIRGADNGSGRKGNKNKRKSRSAEGNDQSDGREDENDEHNPMKRKRSTKQSTMHAILLACPFAKKNPIKYRGCHGYVLKRIKDVKQHLHREHQLPIYCSRCHEIFKSEKDRDDHHRADERCSIRHGIQHEGLTKSQQEQLSVRVSAKMTLEEQWYTIFDILFPGYSPQPESPYINNDLSVDLESFLALMRSDGPSIILSALRTHGIEVSNIRNEERDLDTLLQNVLQEGLQGIAQRWILSLTESETSPTPETQQDATTSASTAPNSQSGSRPSGASSTTQVETERCDQKSTGGDEVWLNQETHDEGTIEYTELASYQPMGAGTSGSEDITRREAFYLLDGTQSNVLPEMLGHLSGNNSEQPQFNLAGALDDNILQEIMQPEYQIGFP